MTDSNEKLQLSLDQLANNEVALGIAEREAEIYRIAHTQKIYHERSNIVKNISKFWYIVLAENDEFVDFISVEDLKYLEDIVNIEVEYELDNHENNQQGIKNFLITFTFESDGKLIPSQVIKKPFKTIILEGEERIVSKPVEIKWPQEMNKINPILIKQNNSNLSKEDKKNYRLGMKSFFSWFQWTGEKPGKEFRHGEDLTRLIVDDLYLNAVKYYVLAINNDDQDDQDDDDDEEDSSEGEELDLSDDENEKVDAKEVAGNEAENEVEKPLKRQKVE
jgi:template-activating factor I